MAQSGVHLTQSKYYSPLFNAAVFDGPIRIYFAQHQEGLALQIYFKLQQQLKETYTAFRNQFKQHGQTVFVMLYPTKESFASSFDSSTTACNVLAERLGDDHVLGVNGPLADEEYTEVYNKVGSILQELIPTQAPELAPTL